MTRDYEFSPRPHAMGDGVHRVRRGDETDVAVLMLPGMGASALMYSAAPYKKIPDVTYVDWPPYRGEDSVSAVAARIIREQGLDAEWVVGGTSLGGVVAAEIAKQISVQKLILISSALSPRSINPVLKTLSGYAEIAPIDLIQLISGKVNLPFNNAMLSMFSQSESRFIRTMCTAVFEWEGNPSPACSVRHIHGADDTIIHPPEYYAEIIQDAGHLLALSHSRQVAAFIRDAIGHA